jgi:ribosome-binding protein aMBF1 (putative translation factor)
MAVSDVGSRIAKRRQQLRLTQAQLAARIGVNRTTVASWETGQHFPQRHQGAIEDVLGVSLTGEIEAEVYTDPVERAIWELDLSRGVRLDFIAQLRARRMKDSQQQEPPA